MEEELDYHCSECGIQISEWMLRDVDGVTVDTCLNCAIKTSLMSCPVCDKNIGMTNVDRANRILGEGWEEMCEECATEFNRKK
jgi:predicted SprT family Zn-dependent metalloprotease